MADRDRGEFRTGVQAVLRHATRRGNREPILEQGLRARASPRHNYPDSDDFCECVCLSTESEHGRVPRWWGDDVLVDVWEVDVTGLSYEDDPNMDENGIRVLGDIPPDRLTLVATLYRRDLVL